MKSRLISHLGGQRFFWLHLYSLVCERAQHVGGWFFFLVGFLFFCLLKCGRILQFFSLAVLIAARILYSILYCRCPEFTYHVNMLLKVQKRAKEITTDWNMCHAVPKTSVFASHFWKIWLWSSWNWLNVSWVNQLELEHLLGGGVGRRTQGKLIW